MDNQEILQGNQFYLKIKERLKTCEDHDPTWQEIMAALIEQDEQGNYMSAIGAFTAYFDEQGLARKIERLRTNGIPKTPRITMEQIMVMRDCENKELLDFTYTSYEDPNEPIITTEQIEDKYSVMKPGREYIAVSFEFSNKQRTEERQLFSALEFYFQELDKFYDADDHIGANYPVMTISAVPLIYGGKYSVHMTSPFYWDFVNLEEATNGEIPRRALTVLFDFENITFIADDDADPDDTFMRCRSELASEWMREMQMRKIEAERENYKQQREAEISEMLGRNKHTFTTTKYGNREQKDTDDVENRG